MSYGKAIEKHSGDEPFSVRHDYRCAARGCPNMGGIGDGKGCYGRDRSGLCYHHHSQPDALKWPELTNRILSDDMMQDPTYLDSPIVADKRRDGDRAWAYALKAREEARERLTPEQKTMWRSAIGRQLEAT